MDKDKKTLVILSPGFPANEQDSTCIPSRQLFVKALKENSSLNIIVLAFQYPFEKRTYEWNGLTVIAFNGRNKGLLHRIRLWLKVLTTLNKIKKEHPVFGILSFWLGECALIGSSFANKNNIKHLTWILGQDAKKGNKYTRLIRPLPSDLIALSDFLADEFSKNYSIKPKHIIPVGIDTSMFESGLKFRDIDIMGAGSLIPLKQYDLFIDIVRSVVKSFPKIKVVICGKGPEKQKLLTLITSNNLQENISMRGEVPHKEVIEFMQRSKVFLHTSGYEGYGTVHAEALYAGCNVVSFCKPMKNDFDHFHLAQNKNDAVEKLVQLLYSQPDHKRVLTCTSADVAWQVRELFTG